jgi:uncharacterized protein YaaR (DUF327 family)
MKRSELKQLIKEEFARQINLSEGLLDKAANALINKMIKSKYGKYFDELYADPEYQEALRGLANAAERIEDSAARYRKAKAESDASYRDLVKHFGKKAADAIRAKNVKKWTTKSGW